MDLREIKGWPDGVAQFDFLDIYECGINALFPFNGRILCLECGAYPKKIRWDSLNGEIIGEYQTEEDFYNAVIMGKSLQSIVDDITMYDLELD